MIRIVPYEPWHLDVIQLEESAPAFGKSNEETKKALQYNMVFTGISDTDVLVIAGLISLWGGVSEATLYISKKYFDGSLPLYTRKTLAKECKRCLTVIIENLKCHRVQATVMASFDRANRFIQWLGFKEESHMPMYGPNKEEYIRYVMFPGVNKW